MSAQLIERIEAASGPCVGLDAEIEHAVGWWSDHHFACWSRYQECGESANPSLPVPVPPSRYTDSIDAALTLVPDGWEVSLYGAVGKIPPEAQLETQKIRDQFRHPISASGSTMALALCAAVLRARGDDQ